MTNEGADEAPFFLYIFSMTAHHYTTRATTPDLIYLQAFPESIVVARVKTLRKLYVPSLQDIFFGTKKINRWTVAERECKIEGTHLEKSFINADSSLNKIFVLFVKYKMGCVPYSLQVEFLSTSLRD
jgi:hypothetical protein